LNRFPRFRTGLGFYPDELNRGCAHFRFSKNTKKFARLTSPGDKNAHAGWAFLHSESKNFSLESEPHLIRGLKYTHRTS